MQNAEWLDGKHRTLVPPQQERQQVQQGLDSVFQALGTASLPIAERYPCGSFAKNTMLAGRREADLVVVLSQAPTSSTVAQMRTVLAGVPGVRVAREHYKSIAVEFDDGVQIDVLPVAKHGITSAAPDVPEKLRQALSGRAHVEWFRGAAHGTPIHPTVRLLKAMAQSRQVWAPLPSFAWEVLAVSWLANETGDLADHFERVVRQVADGRLDGLFLTDPANKNHDVLSGVPASERTGIRREAQHVLRLIENQTWSAVFNATSPPSPATNLGGRTFG